MGRPSKLTEKQWGEIERRLLDGEKPAALAKEYGVNRAALTRRFSQQLQNVRTVANQLATAESALRDLPVAQQLAAISLAETLRAISIHGATAGKFGMMTASRLSELAHKKVAEIKESATLEQSAEAVRTVLAFTDGANKAASIGLNLIAASKGLKTPDAGGSEPIELIERRIVG